MGKKIYIIYENEQWITPLKEAFDKLDAHYEDWFINDKIIDIQSVPPKGVFYNRMSASSHTRGHRFAPEITTSLIGWLELNNRFVINGSKAIKIELSKVEQYLSLKSFGIKTPKTIVVNSVQLLTDAVKMLNIYPFILKPNRGGKGTGVQLFSDLENIKNAIKNKTIGESLDGIWLVQEYIKPYDGTITRVEFVGGEFLYAVKVRATDDFDLCPADSCQINDSFCPVGDNGSKFTIVDKYSNMDLDKYKRFFKANDIGIGALEYSCNSNGEKYVYDVNTNTNYNQKAENEAGCKKHGMSQIAMFLIEQLKSEL
jgi:hypothetical protein